MIAIQSARTEIRDVRTPAGAFIKINNVHACKGTVHEGDSGGLAYVGTDAYGIVVAKDDDDWVFIQSLEDAVAHLAQLTGVALDCFPS